MADHYMVEPTACSPTAGWEKGQVEHQVQTGWVRLNHRDAPIVVPEASDRRNVDRIKLLTNV